jgi:ketosteroid isomerase-like protein
MSEENVELVRRVYDQWKLGNLGAAVELFDPEIVFESFMPDSHERVIARGVEEIEAFTREFLVTSREYRMIGEEFREAGNDKVFVAGRQAVTMKPTPGVFRVATESTSHPRRIATCRAITRSSRSTPTGCESKCFAGRVEPLTRA